MRTGLVKFDQLKAEVVAFCEPLMYLQVRDEESLTVAKDKGRLVQEFLKRAEDVRKEYVDPHNKEVKRINAGHKDVVEPVERVKTHLKNELLIYSRAVEEARAEALRKQDQERREMLQREAERRAELEAHAKAKIDEERALAKELGIDQGRTESERALDQDRARMDRETAQMVVDQENDRKAILDMKVKGKTTRWDFRVVDTRIIPRQLMIVNEKAVREEIRLGARANNIPGIEIFAVEDVRL